MILSDIQKMMLYPKPTKQKKKRGHFFSQKTKKAIYERDGERCILCHGQPSTAHHSYYTSQEKDYNFETANGIDRGVTICMQCHGWIHSGDKDRAERCREYLDNLYGSYEERKNKSS